MFTLPFHHGSWREEPYESNAEGKLVVVGDYSGSNERKENCRDQSTYGQYLIRVHARCGSDN